MCVFLISPVPITEPLTSELIDTPVFYNLAPRPIKYRVSVPIPIHNHSQYCYWKTSILSSPVFLCTYPEQPVCTSLLFISLFIKSQYTVFCTSYCFALFILHILLLFLFFYHIYALVLCYFYIILIFYSFALSTERTWFDYISLLVIPCIIYYVTNKETLNLEPFHVFTAGGIY